MCLNTQVKRQMHSCVFRTRLLTFIQSYSLMLASSTFLNLLKIYIKLLKFLVTKAHKQHSALNRTKRTTISIQPTPSTLVTCNTQMNSLDFEQSAPTKIPPRNHNTPPQILQIHPKGSPYISPPKRNQLQKQTIGHTTQLALLN